MSLDNMVGVGLVTQADDTGNQQVLQITQGAAGFGFMDRVLDKVRQVFSFGFTSVAPIGAVVLFLCRGGDRSNAMAIGTHHAASRPKGLQPGDTAMYDVRGATLKFTAEGPILDCAGLPLIIRNASKLTIAAPEVEMTGSLKVGGTVTGLAAGSVVELGALRDNYNAHHHTGVTGGTATSGGTDEPA